MKLRDDLQYDLCPGCGDIHPNELGLIPTINHSCPANTYEYKQYGGLNFFKLWNDTMAKLYGHERSQMQDFYDLLVFPSFKAMPNFENASYMDKFIYSAVRDMDVAAMKRLRAYVELEDNFYFKY